MKLFTTAANAALLLSSACAFTFAQGTGAKPGEIRILSSNGVKSVVEQVRSQMETKIGHPLSIEYSSAAAFKEKIDAGEQFDVTILTPELIADYTKQGKILPGTGADVARSGIGVSARAGAPKSDISTPDKLKQVLLQAKSITYSKNGAIAQMVGKIIDTLGISNEVKPKLVLQQVPGRATIAVAEGEAELGITLISEILPVKGAQLLGPVPHSLQNYVIMTAGVSTHAKDEAAAKKVIKYLTARAMESTLKANGLEAVTK